MQLGVTLQVAFTRGKTQIFLDFTCELRDESHKRGRLIISMGEGAMCFLYW
jgi:hypothetical protein